MPNQKCLKVLTCRYRIPNNLYIKSMIQHCDICSVIKLFYVFKLWFYFFGRFGCGHQFYARFAAFAVDFRKRQFNCLFAALAQVEKGQSTPALAEAGLPQQTGGTSLGMITEHNLLESCTRLSVSLEQNGIFQVILKHRPN